MPPPTPPASPPASPPPYTSLPNSFGTAASPVSLTSNSTPSSFALTGHKATIFNAYKDKSAEALKSLPGAKFSSADVDKWKNAIDGHHSDGTLSELTKLLDGYFQEARNQSCKRICLFTEKGAVVLKLKGGGAKAYYEPDSNNNIKMSQHAAVDDHLTTTILRCLYEDHAISPIVNTSPEHSGGESVKSKDADKTNFFSGNESVSGDDEAGRMSPGPGDVPYPSEPSEPSEPFESFEPSDPCEPFEPFEPFESFEQSETTSMVSVDGAESKVLLRSLSERNEAVHSLSKKNETVQDNFTMLVDLTRPFVHRSSSREEMERNGPFSMRRQPTVHRQPEVYQKAANDRRYESEESSSSPSSLKSPKLFSSEQSAEPAAPTPKKITLLDIFKVLNLPKGREEETLLREQEELSQMQRENTGHPPACEAKVNKLIEDQQYSRGRVIHFMLSEEGKEAIKKYGKQVLTTGLESASHRSLKTISAIQTKISEIKNAYPIPKDSNPNESIAAVPDTVKFYNSLTPVSLPKLKPKLKPEPEPEPKPPRQS